MMTTNITLISANRWNGGIATKRRWGSSTITEFYVTVDGDHWQQKVRGYGRTPGDRKTYARRAVEAILAQKT